LEIPHEKRVRDDRNKRRVRDDKLFCDAIAEDSSSDNPDRKHRDAKNAKASESIPIRNIGR